jgi:predicted dehydrogenase
MPEEIGRRDFLKTSTAAAAVAGALARPVHAQGDRVNIGWIGTGSRGYYVMGRAYESKDILQVVATCDTYAGNLAKGKDQVQTKGGNTPKTYVDYRELLADPNVNAVVISTPEHLHFPMAMAALKAGKNIYLEKPIAHTIEEGAQIVALAEKTGLVVQVGTQNRSSLLYKRAKEMVEQGMIGECHFTRAFWYRNFDTSAAVPAAWRYVIPADASPDNTDWKRFLEGAKDQKIAFDKHRYFQWRNYWDYSSGISTDLLVHQTDISNFVLGKTVPSSCVASGGIYMWTHEKGDDREVPDTFSAVYEYPDKFELNYSSAFGNDQYGYGEQFMGSEGTIEVISRQYMNFFPQKFNNKPVKERKELHLDRLADLNQQDDGTAAHVRNFLQACLGKEKAIAPARAGQIAAIPGHLATMSYKMNKKVFWDEKTQKYRLS